MLTPSFELTQNEKIVIISILVPYAKISEVDVYYEDYDFMFYMKPYYLRLNLPGKVVCSSDDDIDIKYDFDKRTFIIHVPKAQKGEYFEGLDLLTILLQPKKKDKINNSGVPSIEIIGNAEDDCNEIDFEFEQNPYVHNFTLNDQECGFANLYSFEVFKLKEETSEIFDVKNPDHKTPKQRHEERLEIEEKQFDEDHYIADLYEDEDIQIILKYIPEWDKLNDITKDGLFDEKFNFTSEEKAKLIKLPNKEYKLDNSQIQIVLFGLVDILYGYAYNKRTTQGENTVESGWTINKLSATLSWLETFSSIYEVTKSCIRRSLIYPLYRHFTLSQVILDDVRKILLLGKKYIIKCLLEIHHLFCESEPRYILNDLFITDYCVWVQTKQCSSNHLTNLAKALEKILVKKENLGLNLLDTENFAALAWKLYGPSGNQETLNISEVNEETIKKNSNDINVDMLSVEVDKLNMHTNLSNSNELNIYSKHAELDSDDSSSNESEHSGDSANENNT